MKMKREKSHAVRGVLACMAVLLLVCGPLAGCIGLTYYDPAKTCNGYTLIANDALAKLVDMDGKVVKSWVINCTPVKMFPNGSVMGQWGDEVLQLSWEGETEWRYSDWDESFGTLHSRVHHDFERDGNPVGYYAPGQEPQAHGGKVLVLGRVVTQKPEISSVPLLDDIVYEVDWETKTANLLWKSSQHFEELGFDEEARQLIYNAGGDYLHINSLSRLGPNRWYDPATGQGDARFHPDNLIMDSRQANIIFIVNMAEGTGYDMGEIVWKVGPEFMAGTPEGDKLGQIIGQHHAHMIPKGLPGEGNILVFDNGGAAGYPLLFRLYSRVLEFDPLTLDLVWKYEHTDGNIFTPYGAGHLFFGYFISSAQRLPNGNTLIDEGSAERIFEVTPEGEVVWEFVDGVGIQEPLIRVYRAYRIPPEWVPGNPAGYEPWSELYPAGEAGG
jgi:hypothetical protein